MSVSLKRKSSQDHSISPPPIRRKVQSATTQSAVASFFTPSSQKPPEKTTWQERSIDGGRATLLIGRYEDDLPPAKGHEGSPPGLRRKIAAFDFDSTLIQTVSGKKFGNSAEDWKWWHSSVLGTLQKLHEESYQVVVISNQAGLNLNPDSKTARADENRLLAFKRKVAAVFNHLAFPLSIYAATEKDIFRKPRGGMWNELLKDYGLDKLGGVDLERSFFVGDAGGRIAGNGKPKDFSCSDRNFATNIGITFHTPEEYFLKENPRKFTRSFDPSLFTSTNENHERQEFKKTSDKDIVLFCGSPGAGKSTWYWQNLQPLGYVRINQDILKTREKCLKVAEEALVEGKSVAVDNTNADPEVRSKWIELATKHNISIRCVLFLVDSEVCEHNDAVRALNSTMNPEKRTILPKMAFAGFAKRYKQPSLAEGFQDITTVPFRFQGGEIERALWTRYWI